MQSQIALLHLLCKFTCEKNNKKSRKKVLTRGQKGGNITYVAPRGRPAQKKSEKKLKKVLTNGPVRCIIRKLANERAGIEP